MCISKIATVLDSFVSPTFWHTGLLFQQNPSHPIQTHFFSLCPTLSLLNKDTHSTHIPDTVGVGQPLFQAFAALKGQMAGLRRRQIPERVWSGDSLLSYRKITELLLSTATVRRCIYRCLHITEASIHVIVGLVVHLTKKHTNQLQQYLILHSAIFSISHFFLAAHHRSHSKRHKEAGCVFFLLQSPDLLACFTHKPIIYNERHPEKVDKYVFLQR